MLKITILMFIIIAPMLAGSAVVGVLAMSSPIDGGGSISQGMTILMVAVGAALVALPVSFFVAKMINKTISS